ncbi:MDIS1-interacting receptor like kinase 1-like [Phragmites australis]|uniref:MDIS1-interacting receptor like kinase 1-like n=1 Tax=Phragmites australis TaxID=29695 RepID=UPI002D783621|nr:MDIS1-interacting receptor like kinase 1-like [Phragmites australis]
MYEAIRYAALVVDVFLVSEDEAIFQDGGRPQVRVHLRAVPLGCAYVARVYLQAQIHGEMHALAPLLLFPGAFRPAPASACHAVHPDDLRKLRPFASNLTGGTIPVAWADGAVPRADADGGVVALRLPGRGLVGPSPWDLSPVATVAGLRAANLSSNLLDGELPDLVALPGLAAFDASNSSLSSALTPNLCAGAPALRVLDLSANRLGGALPSSVNSTPPLCAATLRVLFLGSNAFSGTLPTALFGLTGLQKLSLASNEDRGSLMGYQPIWSPKLQLDADNSMHDQNSALWASNLHFQGCWADEHA